MEKITYTKISKIIHIPYIKDGASLCFAEADKHIPFKINRVYYIFNAPESEPRGLHAHRKLNQVLFCISGSITLVLDNGTVREEIFLSEPNQGVFIDRMIWREMKNFKPNTVLLVMASEYFDESDYIRDYKDFLSEVKKESYDMKDHLSQLFPGVRNYLSDWFRVIKNFLLIKL